MKNHGFHGNRRFSLKNADFTEKRHGREIVN